MHWLKSWRGLVLPLILGLALLESALGQYALSPIELHPKRGSDAVPVAILQTIQLEDFRKLVIGAFEASNFSFVAVVKPKEGVTHYTFTYPVLVGKNLQNVALLVRVDENLDKRQRCASCFLRLAELADTQALRKLPWMTQYEVAGQVLPAIDRAYDKIRIDGQASMDKSFKFDHPTQWRGERNYFGNSFVGIDLPGLQAVAIESYRSAGFLLVRNEQKESSNWSTLVFSYPVDSDEPAGVVYSVAFSYRLDERGNCYPCEVKEYYDPYQQLPPTGLSGMANRLTLEARFTAARKLAYERLKAATERNLRPGTTFVVPPNPAPLGSPRPKLSQPPVT